jgi:hypothetical protein
MKVLFAFVVILLFTIVAGCSDDSPTGPGIEQKTSVSINNLVPSSPASLKYYQTGVNDRVNVSFNYNVVEPSGVRIWIQPVDNSPEGSVYYSPSPVYTGSGNKAVTVSVSSSEDTLHISQLRIKIKTPDQSTLISESYIDVNYTFTK